MDLSDLHVRIQYNFKSGFKSSYFPNLIALNIYRFKETAAFLFCFVFIQNLDDIES
jgi:hypothetical protein